MPELEFYMLSLSPDETGEWRYFSFLDEIFLEFDRTKQNGSFRADRSSSAWIGWIASIRNCFHCIVLASNTILVLSEELNLILIDHPSLAVEMTMKTTSAAVVRWAWRQRRHSYSGFSFLARLQHSFTRIFSNYLFNNAGTHRAEDTDLFIYFVKKNHWNSRVRYTIRLPKQTGWRCWLATV